MLIWQESISIDYIALTQDEIAKREAQDCFVNYDKEEICEYLECEEKTYNKYYLSCLESA